MLMYFRYDVIRCAIRLCSAIDKPQHAIGASTPHISAM